MYIRQPSLFSFEELMKYEPQTRLEKIFITLDLSDINKAFSRNGLRGPKGHGRDSMLRALIAKLVYGIPNCAQPVERLKTDLRFKYDCEFPLLKESPSESTFSRFFSALSKKESLQALFNNLIKECMDLGIIAGNNLAIDASEIDAYEKTVPKSKCLDDGKSANWGAKRDSKGNQISWFGYKIHACVDAESELPLAITVTTASQHDSLQTIPLLDKTVAISGHPEYVMMDSGYDQNYIYEYVHNNLSAQAIVALNKRGEKIPPEGLDTDRNPLCSMGYKMVYWGCDKKQVN